MDPRLREDDDFVAVGPKIIASCAVFMVRMGMDYNRTDKGLSLF
jgi:hypothetical protein